MSCPHKPRHLEHSLKENGPILHWLGSLVYGPRLLWQLPWMWFRTHRTCCYCIYRVTVFQGQSDILGNMPSHPGAAVAAVSVHPVCFIYWRVSCQHLHPNWGINFLPVGECLHLTSRDVKDSEDCLRLLQVNPDVFPDMS